MSHSNNFALTNKQEEQKVEIPLWQSIKDNTYFVGEISVRNSKQSQTSKIDRNTSTSRYERR